MDKEEKIDGCASGCSSCAGCGHTHEEAAMPEGMSPIVTLTDENGEDIQFEILDVVALEEEEDKEFLVVTEVTEDEKEDVEVVILEIKQENDEEVYDTVTDDKIAEKVFNQFVKQQEELEASEEE